MHITLNTKSNGKLSEVWVDGSYFPETSHAGAAAVITGPGGVRPYVVAFDLNQMSVEDSLSAELYAAALAIEHVPPHQPVRLYSDNSLVVDALRRIQKGKIKDAIRRYDPAYQRLLFAARSNAALQIQDKVNRKDGKIPIANDFARAAAQGTLKETNRKTKGLDKRHKVEHIYLCPAPDIVKYPFSDDSPYPAHS